MNRFIKIFFSTLVIAGSASCKKDADPQITLTPSSGKQVQLNGIAGSEAGSVAGNSVYLDLSADRTTAVLRAGWDLGFYCGADDYRVVLNNSSSAGAKVTAKFDMASVNESDTIGLTLAPSQLDPQPAHLAYFDKIDGSLSGTVIPPISASDVLNPVIILNRGAGGGIAPRPWIKLRVLRNGTDGYTLQYAGITETTFRTVVIRKDENYNFKKLSFENGVVAAEPEKIKWDLVWTYSVFETNFGAGAVPYNFSDLIAVNHLAGVEVKSKIYADAAAANAAYLAFNRDSVSVNQTTPGRWSIGSAWRSTQPATGARQDRFYLIKDTNGNYYKFKCLAMGVGTDGGIRGRPEFKYALIQ